MPLSQTGSYSHTYIEVTYRCQRIKRGLTRTHISKSHIDANVLNVVLLAHIYRNHISMPM
ncbi:putative acyl-activating enzyme 2 [Gossypium arboreum]|uniref:Putative acyl-activating enzyme 2 n=1 Tax=Gossypium arboreum TaxID=29729 RepID=A0A0B0PXU0_GOSAR|nr:putative acyl-activating enzyme 2 [Gossypium arboreum]